MRHFVQRIERPQLGFFPDAAPLWAAVLFGTSPVITHRSASPYTPAVEDAFTAAREAVALADRSAVGLLRVTGADALDLLDRLSTNHLQDLAPGRGLYTVLTTNKGRIVDLLFVLAQEIHLLVMTGPETRQRVAEWIDFYTFVEDVSVEDVSGETAVLSLVGPNAATLLGDVCSLDGLNTYESASVEVGGTGATVVRTDFLKLPSYDLVVPSGGVSPVREVVLAEGVAHGLAEMGDDALELLRIERGVPVQGKEMTEDANPLEAGLIDYISFNKGCYVGQEVVARLNTYDKVQRTLVGLSWEASVAPDEGAELFADGKKVGVLTSAAVSLRTERGIGLGLVRNAHAEVDVKLDIGSPGGPAAVVEELSY